MSTNGISLKTIKKKDLILKIVAYAVSILLAVLLLVPFIDTLKGIFGSTITYAVQGPSNTVQMVSEKRDGFMTWQEFKSYFDFATLNGFKNSLIVTVLSTIFCIYVSALTAYAIIAYEWKLKRVFNKLILVVVMIPSTVSTIGFYQLVWKFNMINRLSMLIIPAIASPVTVFFMRMYLQSTFSKEIVESARLEGASEFRIFNSIILPIMKPAIATQTIFCFVSTWTTTLVPSIILIDSKSKTLPILSETTYGFTAHGAELLLCIPPIILYAFLSKHIVEGMTLGSVKA